MSLFIICEILIADFIFSVSNMNSAYMLCVCGRRLLHEGIQVMTDFATAVTISSFTGVENLFSYPY